MSPNPTEGLFNVGVKDLIGIKDDIEVTIFSAIGQEITRETIKTSAGQQTTIFSLDVFSAGTYLGKFSNQNFEKTFKHVKI